MAFPFVYHRMPNIHVWRSELFCYFQGEQYTEELKLELKNMGTPIIIIIVMNILGA